MQDNHSIMVIEVDYDSVEIDFKLPKVPAVPSGPEDFSQSARGTVFATRKEVQDNDDSSVEIGTLSASIIQLSRAIDERWNLYDILDAPSHSTAESLGLFQEIDYNTLRLKTPEYNERVRNLFKDDVWVGDILLIERIELREARIDSSDLLPVEGSLPHENVTRSELG